MKEYFEYGGYHFSGYRNFNHEEKSRCLERYYRAWLL